MKLYVIRHGETNMGKNNIIASEDEPLNDTGKKQAIDIGKELRKLSIDRIYCSPIERAKDTLQLFELDKKIPIICYEHLYNAKLNNKNIIRCYSWYDIYEKILEFIKK